MNKVKWMKWNRYSGPRIKGTTPYHLPDDADHWERVLWLTSIVESGGKFGAVIAYDGTGTTAGLTQCIAVYPRELRNEDNNPNDDQGILWKLIEEVRKDNPELLQRLDEEFKEIGWFISPGGQVLHRAGGEIVLGRLLRDELTPPSRGAVPRRGEHWDGAKGWALIFHDIFADPKSFDAQITFATEHTHKVAKRKPKALRGKTIQEIIYEDHLEQLGPSWNKEDPLDLAMSVFWSNSVNAPAIAFSKLQRAVNILKGSSGTSPLDLSLSYHREVMARRLVRLLGTSSYGRWNASEPNGRYQRTRKAAKKVWPARFFKGPKALMPRRL